MRQIITLIFCIILIGCATTKNELPHTNTFMKLPEEVREIVLTNRQSVFVQVDDEVFLNKMKYHTPLTVERDNEIAEILRNSQYPNFTENNLIVPETLTHNEIREEIDFLFDLLRYAYGPYTYFGGDEAFGRVKHEILSQLNEMPDPMPTKDYVIKLLHPNLHTIIKDNHSNIILDLSTFEMLSLGVDYVFYSNEDIIFRKVNNSFITEMNGKEYIKIFQEHRVYYSWGPYIYPSLNANGELVWILGKEVDSKEDYINETIHLIAVESSEGITKEVKLYRASNSYRRELSDEIFSISRINDIPILRNSVHFGNVEVLNEFVKTGEMFSKEPILILDIRSHGGGTAMYGSQWIHSYTNDYPTYQHFMNSVVMNKTVEENFVRMFVALGEQENFFHEHWASQGMSKSKEQFWYMSYSGKINHVKNDNLLIVLMDRYNVSSGELFVDQLRQVDNVLFVGEPTSGCLISDSSLLYCLPISKTLITIGPGLKIRTDFSAFEGYGFKPDLWVAPGESLERVLKFIERK